MQNDDTVTVPVAVEHTAEVPVEAVIPEEPQLDPNRLIEADVAIAQTEAEIERARIEARTAVKIAEIQAEEPLWLNDIRECLTRLETKMEALESRQSSTPPVSNVIVTEPEAPVVMEAPEPSEPDDAEEVTPESSEVPEPEPVRPRRRWI